MGDRAALDNASLASLRGLALAHRELNRRIARNKQSQERGGLIEFVRYFWRVLEPATKLVEGPALYAICEHLEAVACGDVTRLLMNVSPGFMKSLLTDVFWPAWLWGPMNRPHMRFVTFSYAAHLTERDNGRFRDLVRSHEFQALWGDRLSLTEEGKVRVANDKTGWKFASSVGGVGTGERGDVVILDDPHNVKESESDTVRNETVRWFREAMSNRLNDLRTGAIVIIMQRVHEGDVSGCILDNHPEYCLLRIPMEYEPEWHCETPIGWADWRTERGELAWPERFSEATLRPFKQMPFLWAGQYQQRPSPRGGGIIPVSGWEYWDKTVALIYGRGENQFPDLEYVIGSLDPAYGEKQENDFSAFVALGIWRDIHNRPKVIVMTAWQERLPIHSLVEKVIKDCRKLKVDTLLVEAKGPGLSAIQEIRRLQGEELWSVHAIDSGRQDKVARAYSIAPLLGAELENGKRRDGIVFIPCVTENDLLIPRAWGQMLIDQCASFPRGQHDDLVDAFTQGMRHLRDGNMARRAVEVDSEEEQALTHRKPDSTPLYPQ